MYIQQESQTCLFVFPSFLGQNSVISQFGEGRAESQKQKTCLSLSQSMADQKLYNISKNQPLKSIKGEVMGGSPLFDPKKVLFLPYLLSKLCQEIWYVYLTRGLDVPFRSVDFSAPFNPLTTPRKQFFGRVFSFYLSLFLA